MTVVRWLQARQREQTRDGLTMPLQVVKQWDVYYLVQEWSELSQTHKFWRTTSDSH